MTYIQLFLCLATAIIYYFIILFLCAQLTCECFFQSVLDSITQCAAQRGESHLSFCRLDYRQLATNFAIASSQTDPRTSPPKLNNLKQLHGTRKKLQHRERFFTFSKRFSSLCLVYHTLRILAAISYSSSRLHIF